MAGEHGDPDRDGRSRRPSPAGEERSFSHRLADAAGGGEAAGDVGLGQQDHELLTALAERQVDLADDTDHPPGELDQHVVADAVPVPVIDGLEMVEVKHEHAEGATEPRGPLRLTTHRLAQMPQVAQPSQRIGDRQPLGLLQVAEDAVESPTQPAGLVPAAEPCARSQVTGRRPVDSADQDGQRPGRDAGQPPRQPGRDQDRRPDHGGGQGGPDPARIGCGSGCRSVRLGGTNELGRSHGATGRRREPGQEGIIDGPHGVRVSGQLAGAPAHRGPGGQPAHLTRRHLRQRAADRPRPGGVGRGDQDRLTPHGRGQRQPVGGGAEMVALGCEHLPHGRLGPLGIGVGRRNSGGDQRSTDQQRADQDHEEGTREPRAQRHLRASRRPRTGMLS